MLPRSRTLPSRIHHGAMGERHYFEVEAQSEPISETEAINPQDNHSKCFDDDGRLQRTGTFWTATSHIITAVLGSGVLSLAWVMGQFGWAVGPGILVLFAFVNLFTSNLLAECYRFGDTVTGQRNYTYMDAVKANLGGRNVTVCGLIQYLNLFGVAIGCTIAASIRMMAMKRSNCFHSSPEEDLCGMSKNRYMITFGIIEVLLSQIPDLDKVWWLSIVAAIMSFIYSTVGLGFGIGKVAENRFISKGTLEGRALTYPGILNLWRSLHALGVVAFAYPFSIILIEIQDTTKSPPAEYKTMKKAIWLSITVITVLYLLCGCVGYAAFGDFRSGRLKFLTDFGDYNPYWAVVIANIATVVNFVGAYQVYCQPLYAFVEKWSKQKWPNNDFVTAEYDVPIPIYGGIYQLNFFRLVWRTLFVMLTTFIAMLMPYFIIVVGILGAFGFWPLSVYFPIQMHIAQKKIGRWTAQWVALQTLSITCLFVSIAAAVGSCVRAFLYFRYYKPFETIY